MSSKRAVIMTAADEKYFSHLRGLLSSIEAHRQSDVDSIVLDLGFNAEQLVELGSRATRVVRPEWDIEFPQSATTPGWFRAMTARPFLPNYADGYELIIWLDSDTWLQDWRVIELLTQASADWRLAIVPELHRAYAFLYNKMRVLQNIYEGAKAGWDEETAAKLIAMPILNSGAFAMQRGAKHWGIWARNLIGAVQKTNHWLVEQTALNLAVYRDQCPVHLLPAWCNWICGHATPVVDFDRKCLCERYLPYEKLSLVHLTDARNQRATLHTQEERTVESELGYESVKALFAGA